MCETIDKIERLKSKIDLNQINKKNNIELAKLYEENNDYVNAAGIYAFIGQFADDKEYYIEKATKCVYMASKMKNKALEAISYISSPLNSFPEYWSFYLDKDGKLNFRDNFFLFKFLNIKEQEYNQFVCIYNQSYGGNKYNMAKALEETERGDMHFNVKSEIINSKVQKDIKLEKSNSIIEVAATKQGQKIYFEYGSDSKKNKEYKVFNPYEFQFFKIDRDIRISSSSSFVFGEPVKTGHSLDRKKLILDIFIDTLSFKYLSENNFECIKEIYSFFNKGIIFTNNYTIGEYTRPVVSGIRSGLYTYRNGMYNDKVNTKIPEKYKLIAEVLKDYGYNTAEFSGDTGQPSGDLLRGMNRVIVQNGHDYRAPKIIEDVIDHLESFKECDNYVRLSFLDVHRSIEESVNKNIITQVHTDLDNRFEKGNGSNSVFQKSSKEKRLEYKNAVKKVDMHLSLLFKYVLENYNEDEFIVTLSSDHGAMLLDNDDFLLKNFHTNTALMARGSGISEMGLYGSEITSIIDLYPIIISSALKFHQSYKNLDCNLPEVFGGSKRKYVISESLYPGQTYKICIRDEIYEYRLETSENVEYNGHIHLGKFKSQLFERRNHKEIKDDDVKKYFLNIVKKHSNNID